jgi:hypothetical protein
MRFAVQRAWIHTDLKLGILKLSLKDGKLLELGHDVLGVDLGCSHFLQAVCTL